MVQKAESQACETTSNTTLVLCAAFLPYLSHDIIITSLFEYSSNDSLKTVAERAETLSATAEML